MELSEVPACRPDELVADADVLLSISLPQCPFDAHEEKLEFSLGGTAVLAVIVETQQGVLLTGRW